MALAFIGSLWSNLSGESTASIVNIVERFVGNALPCTGIRTGCLVFIELQLAPNCKILLNRSYMFEMLYPSMDSALKGVALVGI